MRKLVIDRLSGPVFIVVFFTACKVTNDRAERESAERMLTQRVWKAEEIRTQLNNGRNSYYKRGSAGTVYDSDSLKFKKDQTGTYYYEGASYPIDWKFTDREKTKMTIVIHQYPETTVYLENIHFTKMAFKYTQYFKGPGTGYLAYCTRVPN